MFLVLTSFTTGCKFRPLIIKLSFNRKNVRGGECSGDEVEAEGEHVAMFGCSCFLFNANVQPPEKNGSRPVLKKELNEGDRNVPETWEMSHLRASDGRTYTSTDPFLAHFPSPV